MKARQATAKAIADPSATDSSLQNTPASSQVPLLLSSSPLFSSGLPPQPLQVVALVGLTNLQASAFQGDSLPNPCLVFGPVRCRCARLSRHTSDTPILGTWV